MSQPQEIHVAAVVIMDRRSRVLTVRKHGTERFMQPGGKPEPGETPQQTARRETLEEIGLSLTEEQLVPMGVFSAPAANEPGHTVVCQTFRVEFDDDAEAVLAELRPASEIAEIRWVPQQQLVAAADLAPLLTEVIAPALREPTGSPG